MAKLASMKDAAFKSINGRIVFNNAEVHIWQCPASRSWRQWQQDQCRVCGVLRDGEPQPAKRVRAASGSGESSLS